MKQGWKMVKLGEVCEVIAGQSPDSKYYNETGVGIPFYQGKKEFTDKYIGAPTTWTTMGTKIAEENDILMSVRAPVGDVNFAIERICIGRGLAAIRSSKMLNKDYLYYYLVCEKVNIKGKEGAVFPSINRNEIRAIEIPLPPLEEQHRIVGILDAAFAKIDALKANAEANLANAKALFQQVLAQELQPKEGWVEKKLGEVVKEIFAGGDAPKGNMSKTITEHYKIPIFANAVEDDGLYGFTDNARVYEPAITIAARGSGTGHVLRRKGAFLPIVRLIVIIPEDYIGIDYMYYALKNINIRKSGAAIPQLTVPMLREYKILFPTDIEDQHRIVSTLDTLSEKCRRLEQVAQQTIRECDALKQSILRRAFSGEL